jgi:hypothetical protein
VAPHDDEPRARIGVLIGDGTDGEGHTAPHGRVTTIAAHCDDA